MTEVKKEAIESLFAEGLEVVKIFRVSNRNDPGKSASPENIYWWSEKVSPEVEVFAQIYNASPTDWTLLDETFEDAIRNERTITVRFERRD